MSDRKSEPIVMAIGWAMLTAVGAFILAFVLMVIAVWVPADAAHRLAMSAWVVMGFATLATLTTIALAFVAGAAEVDRRRADK